MNVRILILLAAILAFALTADAQEAQAEEQAEEAAERAEERAEEAAERAEEQAEEAEERAEERAERAEEEAEKRAEERAKSAEGQAKETEGGSSGPEDITLQIKGEPGTEFSGTCAVGDEETEVSGQVPESFTYELDGERLDCEISKESTDGDLEVVFRANGTRSVQRTNAGTINLTYENGRISSFSTSSSSSGGSSSSSQVISSSQSSSSSITISP